MNGKQLNKALVKLKILDYLIVAADPSRKAIFNMNKLARKYDLRDWLKSHEPTYFIQDSEMKGYLEA